MLEWFIIVVLYTSNPAVEGQPIFMFNKPFETREECMIELQTNANTYFLKGSLAQLNLIKIMLKRLQITGSTLRIRMNKFKGEVLTELKKFVFPLIIERKIKCFVDSVFKFKDVIKAHQRIDEGKHIGKIILNP